MSAPTHSKQRTCYEIQLQNPRGTWLQLHSYKSLHKHARANLARGRSFSSVAARSGLGLTGARERSKSLKIVRLPRNLAPGRTGFLSSAPAQHCIHTRERATHAGGGGLGGGDGKHAHSSAPAQHCIHARESGSALAQAHQRCIHACGGGGDGKHTRSSAPARHCIHTRARGSAPASTHAGAGGGGGGGGGGVGGMVSTPAQAHPLGTASTHAKEEAHLHPRMRVFCRAPKLLHYARCPRT